MSKPLFEKSEWTLDLVYELWDVIDKIATDKYGLSYFEPQVEIVTADQMLYHHSMNAMPISYQHWSYGKNYLENERAYRQGETGLAYETIINTDPMICYIMEDNSATMQAIVLAHAVCGHGSFFKNNYLFKTWTDPSSMLDQLVFAKRFIEKCEDLYGTQQVEWFLDACHSLWYFGMDKYKRERVESNDVLAAKRERWARYEEESADAFWDDMFKQEREDADEALSNWPYPEENLLYFIEKNAPHMEQWKREIVRIVRKQAQYFYPQIQTKLMNEGWASFWHHTLMTDLYEEGYINEGSYLEFIHSHTAVCRQHRVDDVYEKTGKFILPQINPYALGFAMFKDIKRACENPTEEDYECLPLCAGKPWLPTLKWIMENFKDETFILEFLGPRVIKEFDLFCMEDDSKKDTYSVPVIQDREDYITLRKYLAAQYSYTDLMPQIEVIGFRQKTDRSLILRHTVSRGRSLDAEAEKATHKYLMKLWGYPIEVHHVNPDGSVIEVIKRKHL